jgi:hypothetical protein
MYVFSRFGIDRANPKKKDRRCARVDGILYVKCGKKNFDYIIIGDVRSYWAEGSVYTSRINPYTIESVVTTEILFSR